MHSVCILGQLSVDLDGLLLTCRQMECGVKDSSRVIQAQLGKGQLAIQNGDFSLSMITDVGDDAPAPGIAGGPEIPAGLRGKRHGSGDRRIRKTRK